MAETDRSSTRPRLADVAARAGVSLATVSRVLNHTAPVSERTRLRVEEAVHALGYQHQNVGRRQPIQAIALLIPDILNPYFAEIVRGAEEETEHEGLSLVLFNTTEDPEREEQALDRLLHMALEGAVLFGSRVSSERLVAFQQEGQLPVVVINRHVESPNVACVLVDSEQATYRATRYLINMGHSRIAHLAGPSGSASAAARVRGIRRALADAGLGLPDAWCVSSFPDIEGGFQAMSSLLTAGAEVPTGVLAYNDLMALGALHAIRSHGLRVPADISVIGFDDITMAAHANPPLTTIDQPKYRMGRLAVQMLQRMRRGEPVPGEGYVLLESPLVIRESTARAPA